MFKKGKSNVIAALQNFSNQLIGKLKVKSSRFYVVSVLMIVAVVAVSITTRAAINSQKLATSGQKSEIKDVAVQSTTQNPQLEEQETDVPEVQPSSEETNKKLEIITYTVKTGDTLGTIANTYGVNSSVIAASNGIAEDKAIKEGQQLRFPSVKGVLYKVKDGETLWDIASANDVKVDDIVSINNMGSPDKLKINQEIVIPGIEKIKPLKTTAIASVVKKVTVKPSAKTSSSKTASSKTTSKKMVASRGTAVRSTASSSLANLIWPVAVRGIITSPFGYRGSEFHEGIDIATNRGTALKAVADGVVTAVIYRNTSYGNTVKISLGNGVEVYYAHNDKNLVKVGDVVKQGDTIATLGNTGRSSGPHVEFGIKVNGEPVNPEKYLP